MKRSWLVLISLLLILSACGPAPNVGAITPPYVDTGIDPNTWAVVPAGVFPSGQHDHLTPVDYDYEIMVTLVTNEQYARYLNEALAAGTIRVGEVEVEAGELVWVQTGIAGFYPGDPYDGYKHEEEIKAGDKLFMPLSEEGLRLTFDGSQLSAIPEYRNHPMTMVTWFGANAYCEFYDWRLPTEIEWEKAARGTETVDGRGLPFPWGTEIERNNANFVIASKSTAPERISV
jgi:formylglycine-generating enzyme